MILINSSHEVQMSYNDTITISLSLCKNNVAYTPQANEEIWFFLSQNGRLVLKEQPVYDANSELWLISLPSMGDLLPVGLYSYDIKLINDSQTPIQQYTLIPPTVWTVLGVVPND